MQSGFQLLHLIEPVEASVRRQGLHASANKFDLLFADQLLEGLFIHGCNRVVCPPHLKEGGFGPREDSVGVFRLGGEKLRELLDQAIIRQVVISSVSIGTYAAKPAVQNRM